MNAKKIYFLGHDSRKTEKLVGLLVERFGPIVKEKHFDETIQIGDMADSIVIISWTDIAWDGYVRGLITRLRNQGCEVVLHVWDKPNMCGEWRWIKRHDRPDKDDLGALIQALELLLEG